MLVGLRSHTAISRPIPSRAIPSSSGGVVGEAIRDVELPSRAIPSSSGGVLERGEDFPHRDGYEPGFLGLELSLPKLSPEQQKQAAPLLSDPSQTELKYTHFSIVMSRMRRLPFLTAVNIDGANLKSVARKDRWVLDNRLAKYHQLGGEAYSGNDLDRGHMVRRLDPVWGENAVQADADTFAYTNAALQHKDLNRKEWAALEEHILTHARTTEQKMSVFTGPVFNPDDPVFDNGGKVHPSTQIPQQFWKVAVWNNPTEGLQGAGFVLSQEELIDRADHRDGKFDPGRFEVYQVPIRELEEMTGIDFGPVADTTRRGRKLKTAEDVELGMAALETPIELPERELIKVEQ